MATDPEHPAPGRRPEYDARQERYTITLPAHLADRARELGNGNLNSGGSRLTYGGLHDAQD